MNHLNNCRKGKHKISSSTTAKLINFEVQDTEPKVGVAKKMGFGSKFTLVYPENYETASVNTERDMELLVGHFDFMAKEAFWPIPFRCVQLKKNEEVGYAHNSEDSPVMDNNT
ncbi:CGH_1_HP_G0064630.mRNA.1.CDS.1 [Saccharomyces cerevisiae]|nr:CGH_1_HP_G0064630.mRNA.1.CDS.1 [Saccharomyces cerevisiae]CAI6851531.1 CGH_1_HP_G0064630.mRNA.1.CDS.1 [Saccharomyces cerevisiae]